MVFKICEESEKEGQVAQHSESQSFIFVIKYMY